MCVMMTWKNSAPTVLPAVLILTEASPTFKPISEDSADTIATFQYTCPLDPLQSVICCDSDESCTNGDDDWCCYGNFYCSNDGSQYAVDEGGILCPKNEEEQAILMADYLAGRQKPRAMMTM